MTEARGAIMATEVKYNGIGFGGLLTVLFVGLKLTGYIAWSWWWVLSPLWIPLVVAFGFVAVMAVIVVGADFLGRR